MRTLILACTLAAFAPALAAADPPPRPVDPAKLRVVVWDHNWQQPIAAPLRSSRERRGPFATAATFLPDGFKLPYARLRSIEVEARTEAALRVAVAFQCLGEQDPDRRFLVELRALDQNERVLLHTWSLEGDHRIAAAAARDEWNLLEQASAENRPRFSILKDFAARVATLEVVFREMSGRELEHCPPRPHKMKLAITRPADDGTLEFVFANPAGWDLEAEKHEIAFQVTRKDAEGRTVGLDVQFLPYRPDGQYRVKATIRPELFPYSAASATVYTKQPDNDAFRAQFVTRGRGSSYRGVWTADAGPLIELPYVDSPYR
jgi:hypothetical protein